MSAQSVVIGAVAASVDNEIAALKAPTGTHRLIGTMASSGKAARAARRSEAAITEPRLGTHA